MAFFRNPCVNPQDHLPACSCPEFHLWMDTKFVSRLSYNVLPKTCINYFQKGNYAFNISEL